MMRSPRLLLLLATALLAAPASGVTVNVALDQLIASGLGDCTASPPGQCTGTPPDPPVEINSIAGHWGNGLPFDEALLPAATLGPVEMTLPGSVALPMPASFAFLAGGTGGGSGGPDPGVCPPAGQGGVLRSLSFTRSVTVNGVQKSFQQTGSVRVGWCWDVFTLDAAAVPVDTAQGTVTVNVAGAAPVVSNGPTTVSLTSPVAGASFAGNVPLAATASVTIGTINKVEFYRGATLVATVLSPPYTATDAGVPPGSYSYTAKAYNDEDPNEIFLLSTVASVTVTGAVAQQMYFIQTDHLNTPRMIATSTGVTVWRWEQGEPFGNDVPNNNPSGAGAFDFPLRFPGQYFDRETNVAYNFFRDYDPGIGRYVQSDPIGLKAGLNTYAYVGGSPLSFVDPEGLLKWFGKFKMGSLGIGKLGGFKAHFELESECDIDGMKGFATVDGYGATVGIGLPGSGVLGKVDFVDGNIRVDPDVFRGRLRINSIGIQVGPVGLGKTSIFLGGAVSTDVDTVMGLDAGISFGIGGFADVTASHKECCRK